MGVEPIRTSVTHTHHSTLPGLSWVGSQAKPTMQTSHQLGYHVAKTVMLQGWVSDTLIQGRGPQPLLSPGEPCTSNASGYWEPPLFIICSDPMQLPSP